MVNKTLFSGATGARKAPVADTVNAAGGSAYSRSPEAQLAQLAVTGTFNDTFYETGSDQLKQVQELIGKTDPLFVAKTAIYARERGRMKDMPAYLVAALSQKNPEQFEAVFDRVINDGKMLRNVVQMLISPQFKDRISGRVQRNIQRWFRNRTAIQIFHASIGQDPSLADVIRLAHPKPVDAMGRFDAVKDAVFAYLTNPDDKRNTEKWALLPEEIQQFEAFKSDSTLPVPNITFQRLSALKLTDDHWKQIARQMTLRQTLLNLNTMARHHVFDDKDMVELIAARIDDRAAVTDPKQKFLPFAILSAYKYTGGETQSIYRTVKVNPGEVPAKVRNAVQSALNYALSNVPSLGENAYVVIDVSGSMHSPVTGTRDKGATSVVQCIEAASLFAAATFATNEDAKVIAFANDAKWVGGLNSKDSFNTNMGKIIAANGGGTNMEAAMQLIKTSGKPVGTIVFFTDMQTWIESGKRSTSIYGDQGATAMAKTWREIKKAHPKARLVLVNLQPNGTTQIDEKAPDVLHVGGFSDTMFEIIAEFAEGKWGDDHWLNVINRITL